jgi:diguanylate cyclase (GGDEF)-like protein/PAS domain S-box-containing protein
MALILVALAGALALLGAVAAVSYSSLKALGEAQEEERHVHTLLGAVVQMYIRLEQAESWGAAYVQGGRPGAIEAYRVAVREATSLMDEVRRRAEGDASCQRCVEEMEPKIRKRLGLLQAAVEARERGAAAGARDLAAEAEALREIREHLQALLRDEQAALIARDRDSVDRAARAEQVLLVGGLLSLGMIVAVFTVLLLEAAARRRAQRSLEEREAEIQAVVDNAVESIITIDERGIIRSFNPAAEQTFGYRAQEVVGRNVSVLMPPPHTTEHDRYIRRYLETGEGRVIGVGREVEGRRRDGSVFPLELSVSETVLHGRRRFTGIARDATERKQSAEALRQANAAFGVKVGELETRTQEIALLGQMGDLLQSSLEAREAYEIIARFARQLFPGTAGAVCVTDVDRRLVEAVATWGEGSIGERVFGSDDCWALRNGRPHWVEGAVAGGVCAHTGNAPMAGYACLPMMAQGEILGVLHLRTDLPGPLDASRRKLASALGEQVALSLANIRLKETLHRQAIHDPLTGLYNRRYLEDALERELRRAVRKGSPVGILMLDLDHFKEYNDTHGHAAGDALLRSFGAHVLDNIRGEDVACRYGGEEFAIILPDVGLEKAVQRAEQIREGARAIRVESSGRRLEAATVSIGVAALPTHGTTPEAVLRAADAALYAAKAEGRDRVKAAPLT